MNHLRVLEKLWLLGPVVVWFSYQPLLRLGQDNTSHYELSIPLIYLVIVALVGLPSVWRTRRKLLGDRSTWLVGVFVFIGALSLLWTPNGMRGILTTGVVGALYLVFLACLAESSRLRRLMPLFTKILIGSAVAMSLLALVQMFTGIWLDRQSMLLCAGCVAEQFGFVRPNVFTIEPQFFGSLLLAPLLVLLRVLLVKRQSLATVACFILISTVLFLTLSRGAIFAFGLGALILFALHYKQPRRIIQAVLLIVGGFTLALVLQGTAAAMNPKVEESFYGAISASINQVSLGVVDLPAETPTELPTTQKPAPKPRFDGYVKESTDVRLSRSQVALDTWSSSPWHILFGVGEGGSGVAMHRQHPDQLGPREIVQNEYIETLLEHGVVGLASFISVIVALAYALRRQPWSWAIIVAYVAQWPFFSGYPNALHIYLVLIVVFILLRDRLKPAKRY